ncbi:MAG: hypothetical protein R3B45_17830 [Bdellovibrionota bacterium]
MYQLTVLSLLLLIIGACDTGMKATWSYNSPVTVQSQVDINGGTVGTVSAGETNPQELTAGEDSDIAGAAVLFAPGTFSIDVSVGIESGESLVDSNGDFPSELGLSAASVQQSAKPVLVMGDEPPAKPFTISIPVPTSSTLRLTDDFQNLVILYRVKLATGEIKTGVLPRAQIEVKNQLAKFDIAAFGVFQAVVATASLSEAVEVSSTESIRNADGQEVDVTNISSVIEDKSVASSISEDTVAPLSLANFTAKKGLNQGEIKLLLVLPKDISDYNLIKIVRVKGGSLPARSCDSGKIIKTYQGSFVASAQLTYVDATGSQIGDIYSYRVCIYDANANIESSAAVANIQAQDTIAPTALTGFNAITGVNQSEIKLTLQFPSNVSDYNKIKIRRLEGSAAPSADCISNGSDIAFISQFSINPTYFIDNTGSTNGSYFSYRVCIFDSSGNLTSNSTASAYALDSSGPMALLSLAASTGVTQGEINLNWTYPADTADYAYFDIREIQGINAPSINCTDGTVIHTESLPPSSGITNISRITGSMYGDYYSYRVCIYDLNGNMTSTNIAEAIQAYDGAAPISGVLNLTQVMNIEGEIELNWQYPSDVLDYGYLDIREILGTTAPSDCASGNSIYSTTGPFMASATEFFRWVPTGSHGAAHSFLVCIADSSGNQLPSATLVGVQAKDTTAAPDLVGVAGYLGNIHGEIRITMNFPNDVSDYSLLKIYAFENGGPPACGTGVLALSLSSFTGGSVWDQALSQSFNVDVPVSFSFCIYDPSGNLTSGHNLTNIYAYKAPYLCNIDGGSWSSAMGGCYLVDSAPTISQVFSSYAGEKTRVDADNYCNNLTEGGFTDWMLPSAAEAGNLCNRTPTSLYQDMILYSDYPSNTIWRKIWTRDPYLAGTHYTKSLDGVSSIDYPDGSMIGTVCIRIP